MGKPRGGWALKAPPFPGFKSRVGRRVEGSKRESSGFHGTAAFVAPHDLQILECQVLCTCEDAPGCRQTFGVGVGWKRESNVIKTQSKN